MTKPQREALELALFRGKIERVDVHGTTLKNLERMGLLKPINQHEWALTDAGAKAVSKEYASRHPLPSQL